MKIEYSEIEFSSPAMLSVETIFMKLPILLAVLLASCAAKPVSEVDAIFASPSCQHLRQRCPHAKIIVREDGVDETGTMEYYLGTDEDDHTCRVATLRVKDGKVERQVMDADGELKWVVDE